MARKKKFSFLILAVEALGVVVMLKVFVWVLGNKVLHNSRIHVPELDYALVVIGSLLVLRIGYVLIKAELVKRGKLSRVEKSGEPVFEVEVCALCGKPVSEKVLNYCRTNSKRFKGKVYCYDHQRIV